jgi:hypothetical protein
MWPISSSTEARSVHYVYEDLFTVPGGRGSRDSAHRLRRATAPSDHPADVTWADLQTEPHRLASRATAGFDLNSFRLIDKMARQVLEDGPRCPSRDTVEGVAHLAFLAGDAAALAGASRTGAPSIIPAPTSSRRTLSVGCAPSPSQ